MRVFQETILDNRFIPHKPTLRQGTFLAATCLEAMYGGAAGGGKSDGLLMAAVQFVDVPGYAALLLRRTFADLALPGALIDRSRDWWGGEARWNGQEHKWTFPSGSIIQFGYCQNPGDERRYKSSEFQFIGFDEVTEFPEEPYRYMFTRLRRRAGFPVPLRMRSGTNPGGPGHDWVKKRFITHPQPTRLFVPAKLRDNPHLDADQYVASLTEVDPITRAQMLEGDWNAYQGGRFKAQWFSRRYKLVHAELGGHRPGEVVLGSVTVPLSRCQVFMTVDPAASDLNLAKGDDPDYTAISTWAVAQRNQLVWLDCRLIRKEIPDIVPHVQEAYNRWKADYVAIEAVASNRAVLQLAQRTRMAVREVSPRGKDKLVRATKAMVQAEQGRVWLPEWADWLEEVESQVFRFTGDEKKDGHDDIVDTLAYAAIAVDEWCGSTGATPISLGAKHQ